MNTFQKKGDFLRNQNYMKMKEFKIIKLLQHRVHWELRTGKFIWIWIMGSIDLRIAQILKQHWK